MTKLESAFNKLATATDLIVGNTDPKGEPVHVAPMGPDNPVQSPAVAVPKGPDNPKAISHAAVPQGATNEVHGEPVATPTGGNNPVSGPPNGLDHYVKMAVLQGFLEEVYGIDSTSEE